MNKNILNEFIDYWTEPNKSNTKMKFELSPTWDTNLRLKKCKYFEHRVVKACLR